MRLLKMLNRQVSRKRLVSPGARMDEELLVVDIKTSTKVQTPVGHFGGSPIWETETQGVLQNICTAKVGWMPTSNKTSWAALPYTPVSLFFGKEKQKGMKYDWQIYTWAGVWWMWMYLQCSVWPSGSGSPAFHGDAPLQLLISPFASHFCILFLKYVVPVYLCEGLKYVFQVDDKLAELGCIAV